jgi:ribonuclease HI
MNNIYTIYTDGGSRGNPGPAAIGVVIASQDGTLKKSYGEYIGEKTNNEAEYRAVIFALQKLKQLIGSKAKTAQVDFRCDSELLVKQMNGEYKISNPGIQQFFIEIWNLKLDYASVSFTHVYREDNKEADKMVNIALDKHLGGGLL